MAGAYPLQVRSNIIFLWLGLTAAVAAGLGQKDFWDLPPILYSDTMASDSLAKLAGRLASGEKKMEGMNGKQRLDFVPKALDVPVESQVLVFSKTSLQNGLIHPKNPRSLYSSGFFPGMILAWIGFPDRRGGAFLPSWKRRWMAGSENVLIAGHPGPSLQLCVR